jgi:O-antigen biosynthesis protein
MGVSEDQQSRYETVRDSIRRVLPRNSIAYRGLRKLTRPLVRIYVGDIAYKNWIKLMEPKLWAPVENYKFEPLISIVVPAYNTPDRYLFPLLDSIISQTYTNWELCLVQASPDPERAEAIRAAALKDERIRVIEMKENLGISGNTNAGIEAAKGEYVAFADHDDTLSPHALNEVVRRLQTTKYDLVYSDEDKLSDDGQKRLHPFFKPDWSPDLLRHVNYITHFVVIKTALARKVGGIRREFDGAQDFDFLLRVSEHNPSICHIPKLLYHWRIAQGSTARDIGEKSYAHERGKRAVIEHLKRTGVKAEVISAGRATNHRIRYATKPASVSVLIAGSGLTPSETAAFMKKISDNTDHKDLQFIVGRYDKHGFPGLRSSTLEVEEGTSLADIFTALADKAEGDILIFTHGQIEPLRPDWLRELIGIVQQPGVGFVTPYLFGKTGHIYSTGAAIGLDGSIGYPFAGLRPDIATYVGHTDWPRNFTVLPGDCLATQQKTFKALKASLHSRTAFNVALTGAASDQGLRNVFWPESLVKCLGSYSLLDPYLTPNIDSSSEQIHFAQPIKFGESK